MAPDAMNGETLRGRGGGLGRALRWDPSSREGRLLIGHLALAHGGQAPWFSCLFLGFAPAWRSWNPGPFPLHPGENGSGQGPRRRPCCLQTQPLAEGFSLLWHGL